MTSLREALNLSNGGIISLVGAGGKTSLMNALAAEFSKHGQSVLITTTTKIERPKVHQAPVVVIEHDTQKLISECRAAVQEHAIVAAAANCNEARSKLVGYAPEVIDQVWESEIFDWIVVEADGAARKPLKAPAEHEPVIPGASNWVIGLIGLRGIGKPFTDQWVFRPKYFQRISGLRPGEIVSAAAIAAVLQDSRGLMKGAPAGARKIFFLNQADSSEQTANGRQIASLLDKNPSGFERAVIGQLMPTTKIIECIDLLD